MSFFSNAIIETYRRASFASTKPVHIRSAVVGAGLSLTATLAGVAGYRALEKSPADVVAQAEPAVVFITAEKPDGTDGVGSGFIVGRKGEIVTCAHVASEEHSKITVTLYDGRSFPAQLIGADPETDVSMIKINAGKHLPTLSLGNSDAIRQGDPVTEIGNPLAIKFSATFGRVSYVHRSRGDKPHADYVQFDAATNRGNSGGPLIDAAGYVVGMASDIVSPTSRIFIEHENMAQSSGVALAVSSAQLKKAVGDIRLYGKVRSALPRFFVGDVTPPAANSRVPPLETGARIMSVETGSGAEQIGLKAGDVIVGFDDRKIGTANDFNVAVYLTSPGERHLLTVKRGDNTSKFDLTMGGDIAPVHPLPPQPKTLAAPYKILDWRQ